LIIINSTGGFISNQAPNPNLFAFGEEIFNFVKHFQFL